MSKADISIIVPVFNAEKYLEECIDSLLAQTKKEIEIVLIDDGSTDMSGSICDEYEKKYPNIQVIHQKNQGQSVALNRGIAISKGDYILYVDSDDVITKDACEKLFDIAFKYDCDIVRGDMIGFGRTTEFDYKKVTTLQYMESAVRHRYYDIVKVLDLTKKDLLRKRNIKLIENCYYEDQEYMLNLLYDHNTSIVKIPLEFYYYRPNENSITHNHNRKKGVDFIRIIDEMQNDIECRPDLAQYSEYSGTVLAYAIWHFKEVWLHLSRSERKELHKLFIDILQMNLLYTKKLAKTKQVELRLFIYVPHLLVMIDSFTDLLRKNKLIKKLYHKLVHFS